MGFDSVSEHFNFPQEELKVLKLWHDLNAFETSLKLAEGRKPYSFYDGPPFATGLPHYGHLLAGTIKDIVTRYAAQSGFYVERRFGWDTHGLPIEFEIDKALGISGRDAVMKLGIAKYNAECRSIVMRYANEWEATVNRMGRWIDFKNDYKTMYPWFMESVWWVFKQMWEKNLVYQGFKVMPFSTACNTPLSNFEVQQNYKEIVDPTVVVTFPLVEEPGVSLLAWTTTPWTLPSNLGLCVNPDLEYVKIKDVATGSVYILMEKRLEMLYKDPRGKDKKKYEVLDRFPGAKLVGLRYTPIFQYFADHEGAFVVVSDAYVTDDSGTGIVHQAPAFGEDDYRVMMHYGVIKKGGRLPCPVDDSGKFTAEVSDFAGQHVKDADKDIIKMLKQLGRLVVQSNFSHNYPFCWRSETPLIYKAVPSWFVRVEEFRDRLVANNKKTYWVPEFVGTQRFQNWLEGARDWAISRNRYWGTPLPIWVSEDGEEAICVGSIAELEELTGTKVTDLHRESIDHLEIPSRQGKGMLRRVEEVFDCWFESGSMPYAQKHYPFENKEEFDATFPADFIAEGLDQTRGWFYTLLVISTALFDKPPFKNLICNGLVLAADGKKMSKRLKNYPDPNHVLSEYGADALRLYLINSPVVRAETLRFKEEGVKDVIKDVFLPWYNAYRFFMQNTERLHEKFGIEFQYDLRQHNASVNIMDRWILASIHSLLQYVKEEMAAYRLYTVVPRLLKFIDDLTNWYVRLNRKRMRGEETERDCVDSLGTLFEVLYTLTKLMAPFTPFLAENMYQNLRKGLAHPDSAQDDRSVHYLLATEPKPEYFNPEIQARVARMQAVVELARVIRERKTLPVKYPLRELVVLHPDQGYLDDVKAMEVYIKTELNVRDIVLSSDEKKYGLSLRAEPDFKLLGKRLGADLKTVRPQILAMDDAMCRKYAAEGSVTIGGHVLSGDDVKIIRVFDSSATAGHTFESNSDNDVVVLLDVAQQDDMREEGLAREVINRVQKLRKKGGVQPSEPVYIVYDVTRSTPETDLNAVVKTYQAYIEKALGQPFVAKADAAGNPIVADDFQIGDAQIALAVVRRDQQNGTH